LIFLNKKTTDSPFGLSVFLFSNYIIFIAFVTLIMLIVHDFNFFSDIILKERLHFILDAAVAVDKKSFVAFTEGNPASGKIIKINFCSFVIMPVPDFEVAVRINKKISITFRFIKFAAMEKEFSVHIEKKANLFVFMLSHFSFSFQRFYILILILFSLVINI